VNLKPPPPFILASRSPRRKKLLEDAGYVFRVVIPEIKEVSHGGEAPEAYAIRMAQQKAGWVVEREGRDEIVLAADTVVVLDDLTLGKPRDESDARQMLQRLSGRQHIVITGCCLSLPEPEGQTKLRTFQDGTRVWFRSLAEEEITAYIATGEPMDKAGAYAIQGGAAGFVEKIDGSFTNVVGLPMERVAAELAHPIPS